MSCQPVSSGNASSLILFYVQISLMNSSRIQTYLQETWNIASSMLTFQGPLKPLETMFHNALLLKLLTATRGWSSGTMPWTMEWTVLMHLLHFWEFVCNHFLWQCPMDSCEYILPEATPLCDHLVNHHVFFQPGAEVITPLNLTTLIISNGSDSDSERLSTILSQSSIISKVLHF